MSCVSSDIYNTRLVINGNRKINYGKIFFHSNEHLRKIFSNIDVEKKDVLTVLGSSDL